MFNGKIHECDATEHTVIIVRKSAFCVYTIVFLGAESRDLIGIQIDSLEI